MKNGLYERQKNRRTKYKKKKHTDTHTKMYVTHDH